MNWECSSTLIGPAPEPFGGVKMINIIKLQLQSQFQRFVIPNFVRVLANKRYKTYGA